MNKKGGFLLRFGVSLAALAGLLYFLRGKLIESFSLVTTGLAWTWFLAAVGVYVFAVILISWRLQLIFRVQGVKVTLTQSSYLSFLGHFFTLFFPSALGGDVAKGYYAYQYSGKKLGSLTGVVLDRLLGFVTLVVISVIALLGYSRASSTPLVERSLYGALGLLVFGTVFFTNHRFAQRFQFLHVLVPSKKWKKSLGDLYHAIRNYQNHKGVLASSLAISFVAQFLFFLDVFLLGKSLGARASLSPYFVLTPLVAFVSMTPSLSGLGVREAGFVFFFKSVMSSEKALALSLAYDAVFYGLAIFAGIVFAFRGGLTKKAIHDLEEAEALQEVGQGGRND